jgi:hypothetical protein
MGDNAREIAEKNFKSRYLTEELISYYKKIIKAYPSRREILHRINLKTLVPLFRATKAIDKFLNS